MRARRPGNDRYRCCCAAGREQLIRRRRNQPGQRDAAERAAADDDRRFDGELRDDARGTGAEREAHRHLAPPVYRARQLQIDDVRDRDQQHQAGNTLQPQRDARRVGEQRRLWVRLGSIGARTTRAVGSANSVPSIVRRYMALICSATVPRRRAPPARAPAPSACGTSSRLIVHLDPARRLPRAAAPTPQSVPDCRQRSRGRRDADHGEGLHAELQRSSEHVRDRRRTRPRQKLSLRTITGGRKARDRPPA